VKKVSYVAAGTLLVVVATLVQRFDGGGADVAGMIVLGVVLLIASVDVPTRTTHRKDSRA
jgi:hypothetical protein